MTRSLMTLKELVMDSSTKLSSIEKQLHRARINIERYKECRQAAESVKAQAEFELRNAKNTVRNLFSMIEELGFKEKFQKPLSKNDNDNEYSQVMRELEHAKRELFQLKLDVASVSEEKLRAEKQIEVSRLNMMSCSRVEQELRREIEVVGEEQLLVELARIDALKDTEASRKKEANELSFELESTRNKLKEAVKEINESKELETKLAMTISDIDVLQEELKFVKGKELQIVKEEIEGAKKDLSLIKEEGFQFMTFMDAIRNEKKNVTAETVEFKKVESKVGSKVHNLKSKLLRAKSKLEDVSSAEEKAKSIVISLSHSLENLKTQTVAAKTELELIHQEVNATKEEIKKTEFDTDMIEEKLKGAMRELEGIKSSEVLALEKLKTITEIAMRDRGLGTKFVPSSLITISKFEYEYLTNHAAEAKEIADKKVAAAKASIEALKASEMEILMKTKMAEMKLEDYTKEKLVPKRDRNEELENPSRDMHRAMSRKSNKLDGSVTPSKGSKFQNSASPPARHVSPFTIKKKTKVIPNFTKFFRGKRSTTSTL